MTRRAFDLLGSSRNDHYEAGLAALREDTQVWWAATIACDPAELQEDEKPHNADVEGLRRFLEAELMPWAATRSISIASSNECCPCCSA